MHQNTKAVRSNIIILEMREHKKGKLKLPIIANHPNTETSPPADKTKWMKQLEMTSSEESILITFTAIKQGISYQIDTVRNCCTWILNRMWNNNKGIYTIPPCQNINKHTPASFQGHLHLTGGFYPWARRPSLNPLRVWAAPPTTEPQNGIKAI